MLKELRKARKLNQEQLAEALGWKQVYVSRYETGEVIMPVDKLMEAAKFFNVYSSTILGEIPIGACASEYILDIGATKLYRTVLHEVLAKCSKHYMSMAPDKIVRIVDKTYDRVKDNPDAAKISDIVDLLLSYEDFPAA